MKRYILTVLLQIDELVQSIFWGYANETISYRFALDASEGKWFGCLFCKVIQKFFPKHCDLANPPKATTLQRPL